MVVILWEREAGKADAVYRTFSSEEWSGGEFWISRVFLRDKFKVE
jgi:hypothetical protein